jgi:hypothetical protein
LNELRNIQDQIKQGKKEYLNVMKRASVKPMDSLNQKEELVKESE